MIIITVKCCFEERKEISTSFVIKPFYYKHISKAIERLFCLIDMLGENAHSVIIKHDHSFMITLYKSAYSISEFKKTVRQTIYGQNHLLYARGRTA
jgi:hypothetical protein